LRDIASWGFCKSKGEIRVPVHTCLQSGHTKLMVVLPLKRVPGLEKVQKSNQGLHRDSNAGPPAI